MKKAPKPVLSYIIIGLCVLLYAAAYFTPGLNSLEAAILFGAFYKPMILCGEYWRVLTVGLTHGSLIHLFMNCYSLLVLGRFLEFRAGKLKYAFILMISVIGGSLFQLVGKDNTVCVGLSGGLYGLMAAMIYVLWKDGAMKSPTMQIYIRRVLITNLFINFLPNVAWKAHLGGFIAGLAVSVLLLSGEKEKELKRHTVIASVLLIVALAFFIPKNAEIRESETYFLSDAHVLMVEKEIGLSAHADSVAKKLDALYNVDISVYDMINGG